MRVGSAVLLALLGTWAGRSVSDGIGAICAGYNAEQPPVGEALSGVADVSRGPYDYQVEQPGVHTVSVNDLVEYLNQNPDANLEDPNLQKIIEALGGKIETIEIKPGEGINMALERAFGEEGKVGYQGYLAQLDPNINETGNPNFVKPGQVVQVVRFPEELAEQIEKLTIATPNGEGGYTIKYGGSVN
ncbi:MAG: hypothetical protein N3A71_03005 [Candidatus Dojkabacteria bacterium]|nr:hypothetical protein [Candidatus Dojkabacteria bacterium]